MALATTFPGTAHAIALDQGAFGLALVLWECGTGTHSWTCHYELYSQDCVEASVGTGVDPAVTVGCHVYVDGRVTVQHRLTASGQRVGCTSVAGSTTTASYVSYRSGLGIAFSNSAIQPVTVDVRDGVVSYYATESDAARQWIAVGNFGASCAQGSDNWQWGDGASGTVTVRSSV